MRRKLRYLLPLALLVLVISWWAYRIIYDGIVYSGPSVDPHVQNGQAYEKAVVNLAGYSLLVVPDDAPVERTDDKSQVEIYIVKNLCYGGHPGEEMSIREVRTRMGCAQRATNGTLTIATYGEWDTPFEGGAEIRLLIRVPSEMRVEKRAGLSGPFMASQVGRENKSRERIEPGKDGWEIIPSQPDRSMTLKHRASP
jgi:hypothetical protein